MFRFAKIRRVYVREGGQSSVVSSCFGALDFHYSLVYTTPMLTLKGEIREKNVNLTALRAQGFIPAVYYGHKEKPVACVVPKSEFKKVWKEAGESTIVVLDTPKGKVNTLIQEVQVDPVRGEPIHADFYVLEKGKKVEVHIPVEFIGIAPAVKDFGGTLVKVLHEIEIEALL